MSALLHILYIVHGSMCHSEVRKEIFIEGERDRGCSPEVGAIDPGRGEDDYCTDLRCSQCSCEKYEGSNGRCAMLARLFIYFSEHWLSLVPSIRWRGVNGYNSMRVGYVSRVEQVSTVLTPIRSRYSPSDK